MKTVRFTLGHDFREYQCNLDFDQSGEYVRAEVAHDLLVACEMQHKAIDWLMSRLIERDPGFLPSHSPAWPAVVEGDAAIKKARGTNA
jgi:hypothetical protein